MLCYVMLCYVMLCYVMLYYIISYYIILYHIILSYVILSYLRLCYVIFLSFYFVVYVTCNPMGYYITEHQSFATNDENLHSEPSTVKTGTAGRPKL